MPERADQYGGAAEQQRDRAPAPARHLPAGHRDACSRSASRVRCCAPPATRWDLRKAAPYSSYEDFDFKIPVGTEGDNYDRYAVRLAEMYESTKIVKQALDGLPEGPRITEDRKVALPPRHELATSMEALIHHFKLVTEGMRVPPGEVYYPIESPRGELGCFVRSDGSSKPARVHMRDPSFVNLQATAPDGRGLVHRRHDRDARDDRPRAGGRRPMSSRRPRPRCARFEHGSRVPGWDRAADLRRIRRRSRTRQHATCPPSCARRSSSAWPHYPDRRSAALPALLAAQRVHGWCSPEAIEQVACVMRLTPAYLASVATFYDMLENEPVGRHSVYVCTNISCSLRGADALLRAIREAAAGDPDVNVRAFECLGACDIAPMASVDGVYVGPLRIERRAGAARGRARGAPGAARAPAGPPPVADPRANCGEYPCPGPEPQQEGRR